jgi:putative transposase
MTDYRRCRHPGGTYFFTVNLANRRKASLTENIGTLRAAFRQVLQRHPFTIQAIVVLAEHIHCLLELPASDCDYSMRWRQIKSVFFKAPPRDERISGAGRARRAGDLAATLLGAHHPGRCRVRIPLRLHSL